MYSILRIGIVGGTFNPIHIAHLVIAETFSEQMQLDKCIFVPANMSPFKIDNDQLNLTTPAQRLEMVNIAVDSNPKFETDSFEIEKKGVSYTYDTVLYFKERFPDSELFLLIGTDQAMEFIRWNNWKKILEMAGICIVQRPPFIDESGRKQINEMLTVNGRSPVWIDAPYMDISSTGIRKKLSLGMTIKYIVPDQVEEFINKNKLYR